MRIPTVIIDVFFSVLLVFVVLSYSANPDAQATDEKQLPDVILSSTDAGKAKTSEDRIVHITIKGDPQKGPQIFVENELIELANLNTKIDQESRVLIRPDRNGKIDILMKLMAELSRLKVKDIGFAVETPS